MPETEQPNLFEQSAAGLTGGRRTDTDVVIREVPCRNLLNRSGISDYSFNRYTGCLPRGHNHNPERGTTAT